MRFPTLVSTFFGASANYTEPYFRSLIDTWGDFIYPCIVRFMLPARLIHLQGVVFNLHIGNYLPVILCLVLSVFTDVVSVTEQTLVDTEVGVVLLSHLFSGLLCRLQVIVGNLGLTGVLVDVGVDAESTPGITSDEEVPEPGLPFNLVLEPDLEILPLYFRFLFHSVYERIRTSIACYFSSPPTKCGINGI